MSYLHSMACDTQGIRPTVPVQWRGLDGLVGVYWQAEGRAGASGYYLSPDPRIVFFLNDVSGHIRVSNQDDPAAGGRPMVRALYVPAGVPMWTRFSGDHAFAHLDLHVHRDRLLRFLAPSLGRSQALTALRRPVEMQDAPALDTLARLLIDEIASPTRHGVYAENLVGSVFGYLLQASEPAPDPAPGLTAAQLDALDARLAERPDHRMSVAEMADCLGLSESWFAHRFKAATGTTPLQWQLSRRVERAQHLLLHSDLRLADIAGQLGFADQAHLTRVFRQTCGAPPAAWLRHNRQPRPC